MTGSGYRKLIGAVFYKELLLTVRYPMNFLGSIVATVVIFSIMFYGGRAVAGAALTDSIEGIIVGYFLWILASGLYTEFTNNVRSEAEWGTLERHFITPFGFATVMFLKAVAKLFITMLVGGGTLVVMLLLTGERLSVDVLTVLPLVVFTLASVAGIGFAVAGLTVLYKQIGKWMGMLQFGFVGLIAAPTFDYGLAVYLPLAQGSVLLQQAMTDGVRLWEFALADLAVLAGTGAGYLLVGVLVFQLTQRRARDLGVLGHY